MKLLLAIAFVTAAGCGSKKPAATSTPAAPAAATTGSATEVPNTDACAAVHGHCVTGEAGAKCQSTSAEECPQGQVCCSP